MVGKLTVQLPSLRKRKRPADEPSVIVSVLTAPCIVNDRMQYKFLNSELVKARQLL